ncbi:MAG: cytochrome b N-terminal domain-containing protein [Pseudomonadota bacterium]
MANKNKVVLADVLSGGLKWVDDRFPLTSNIKAHLTEYYAPKNFNFWYFFGSLALLVLVLQIVTGIFLTMHYKPDAELAFGSVEYIMRDVPWGWLIRYMHSTGASMFFVVVYLHMFRGIIYSSYRNPRELIWLFGVAIFLALMGEAFFGYLLPWGQMSYWGAQVIVNLFSAIPFVGPDVSEWLRGDYLVSDATLNRFFAFHVIALPFVLAGLVVAHLIALHEVGSNNPDGVEIKKLKNKETGIPLDGIPFHPYYTVKDLVGVAMFLIVFSAIVFFAPEMGGYFLEANNFVPANPLVTPAHIAPVWYFTPYYSVLRAVPPILNSQFPGVAAMGLSVMVFALLPWLDKGAVKSIRYRGLLYKKWLTAFVVSFLILGYLGTEPSNVWGQFGAWLGGADRATVVARVATVVYFAFFVLMPWYTKKDKTLPEPERVTG